MTTTYTQYLADENATCQFGEMFIHAIVTTQTQDITLYLNGELGAGKTTLSRGILQGLGWKGKVKSPTYTLVEEYKIGDKNIYHFDLYRLASPEELEFMGIRDYFNNNSICLIEWAEKGMGWINPADILVNLIYLHGGRQVELIAQTAQGKQILTQLHASQ